MRHPILITILSVALVTFLVVIFDGSPSTSASAPASPAVHARTFHPTATEEHWLGQNEKLAVEQAKITEREDRLEQ